MSSQKCNKAANKEVENKVGQLDPNATTPIPKSYSPELDSTEELGGNNTTY